MSNFYLHRDGQNHGPYSLDQMQELITSGQVNGEEPICAEGGTEWSTASTLVATAPAVAAAVTPAVPALTATVAAPRLVAGGGSANASFMTGGSATPAQTTPADAVASGVGLGVGGGLPVTEDQVRQAVLKTKAPLIGIVISVFAPIVVWSAKNDAARGVHSNPSGKHAGLKALAQNNTEYLPYIIVIGVIGAILCTLWFIKCRKNIKELKAQLLQQQMGH